ncbi:MAG: aconitase X catalytic domain-containing protein [Candidatus Methanofastidiosum sp.]|nr:aconitase X catalytic domain-containing protein [Methanofastidiosum sp.]
MYLSKEEERILDGEEGYAAQKSMEILSSLGDIYGADKLIPISSCQIAGASYKTIGDAGLFFVSEFAKSSRVKVKSTLNPIGMDSTEWQRMGIKKEFAEKQLDILDAYLKMGIDCSCTCTPYLIGNRPNCGEHVAWSESSAVSFVNSVLGAKSNREGGPSSLASSIIGKTPNYGLHLEQNRKAGIIVDIKTKIKSFSDVGALGNYVGSIVGNKIPYFKNLELNSDKLKSLGASMAASGSVALYHVEDLTPEYGKAIGDELEKIEIGKEEIEESKCKLNSSDDMELICIGCPHCSVGEVKEALELFKKEGRQFKGDIWICTSRHVKNELERTGVAQEIEKYAKLLADTCMVVTPIEEMYEKTATNSGKAAVYLPSLCKQKVRFGDLDSLIRDFK